MANSLRVLCASHLHWWVLILALLLIEGMSKPTHHARLDRLEELTGSRNIDYNKVRTLIDNDNTFRRKR